MGKKLETSTSNVREICVNKPAIWSRYGELLMKAVSAIEIPSP
jgi:hypothetical protein